MSLQASHFSFFFPFVGFVSHVIQPAARTADHAERTPETKRHVLPTSPMEALACLKGTTRTGHAQIEHAPSHVCVPFDSNCQFSIGIKLARLTHLPTPLRTLKGHKRISPLLRVDDMIPNPANGGKPSRRHKISITLHVGNTGNDHEFLCDYFSNTTVKCDADFTLAMENTTFVWYNRPHESHQKID